MLEHVGIFADGVAVRQVGEHTFALCRRYLDGGSRYDRRDLRRDQGRLPGHPHGARAGGRALVAGMKRRRASGTLPPGAVVAIASGANMNFTRLGYVAERAEVGEHREAILAVTIPERPGAFLEFCRVIGERSVTEFNYRLASRAEAHIFVGVEVSGPRGGGRRSARRSRPAATPAST